MKLKLCLISSISKPQLSVLVIVFNLLLHYTAEAQTNLVPNPSFELYNECPSSYGVGGIGNPLTLSKWAKDWYSPSRNYTADYFNTCDNYFYFHGIPSNILGYQYPRTGNAHAGFTARDSGLSNATVEWARSYLTTKLISKLTRDSVYHIIFYVSLCNNDNEPDWTRRYWSMGSTTNIGMYFTADSLPPIDDDGRSYQFFIPQFHTPSDKFLDDTLNWMKVEGYYTAKGGEQWIIIGSFGNQSSTPFKWMIPGPNDRIRSYYFIDDVSITLADIKDTRKDTTMCKGSDFRFDMREGSDSCVWFDKDTSEYRLLNKTGIYWVSSYLNNTRITDTLFLTVLDSMPQTIDTGFCEGQNILISTQHISPYLWSTGETTANITITHPGIYWVHSQSVCTVTDSFYVKEFALPIINTVKDTVVCFDEVPKILLDAGRFKNYLWQPTGETTRTIYSTHAEIYLLTVTDSNNCSSQRGFAVMETCPESIYVPNAFTPNNDGVNDFFEVKGNDITDFDLKIFNRYGERVFSSVSVSKGWDGTYKNKPCASDTYVYSIECRFKQGTFKYVKGNVTLLR